MIRITPPPMVALLRTSTGSSFASAVLRHRPFLSHPRQVIARLGSALTLTIRGISAARLRPEEEPVPADALVAELPESSDRVPIGDDVVFGVDRLR